jgi:hypothetical protein
MRRKTMIIDKLVEIKENIDIVTHELENGSVFDALDKLKDMRYTIQDSIDDLDSQSEAEMLKGYK